MQVNIDLNLSLYKALWKFYLCLCFIDSQTFEICSRSWTKCFLVLSAQNPLKFKLLWKLVYKSKIFYVNALSFSLLKLEVWQSGHNLLQLHTYYLDTIQDFLIA